MLRTGVWLHQKQYNLDCSKYRPKGLYLKIIVSYLPSKMRSVAKVIWNLTQSVWVESR